VLDRQSRAIVASNSFISDDQCSFNPEYQVLYGAGIAAVCELLHSALFGRSKGYEGSVTGCKNKPSLSAELARAADEVIDLLRLLTAAHGTTQRFVPTHRRGRYCRHSGHARSIANVRMRRDRPNPVINRSEMPHCGEPRT